MPVAVRRPKSPSGKLKQAPIVRQLALAEELRALLDSGDVNQSGLAHLYGLTRARVTQLLNLLKLHPAILAHLRRADRFTNRLSERALRPLAYLPPEEQVRQARRVLRDFPSPVVRAEALLDADPRCPRRRT